MNKKKIFNLVTQLMLPAMTIGGQAAVSLKHPEF